MSKKTGLETNLTKKQIELMHQQEVRRNFKERDNTKDAWTKQQGRDEANIYSTATQSLRTNIRHPNLYQHPTSTPGGGIHTSEVFYKATTSFA